MCGGQFHRGIKGVCGGGVIIPKKTQEKTHIPQSKAITFLPQYTQHFFSLVLFMQLLSSQRPLASGLNDEIIITKHKCNSDLYLKHPCLSNKARFKRCPLYKKKKKNESIFLISLMWLPRILRHPQLKQQASELKGTWGGQRAFTEEIRKAERSQLTYSSLLKD